jgi:glycosyltransferase involved in cell wall biosynthesis
VPDGVADRVQLAGFVPDLRPLLHDSAVYVVPLRVGSGTRLKVLEAMALGKAIVTTALGSEGIALRDGESALFADDADGFARAVIALLDAPATRLRLAAAARSCAESHYGWDAIGARLQGLYAAVLASTR